MKRHFESNPISWKRITTWERRWRPSQAVCPRRLLTLKRRSGFDLTRRCGRCWTGCEPWRALMGKAHRTSTEAVSSSTGLWIYGVLFLATFLVYFQVGEFDFVDYDDPQYINNPHVCQGFTQEGLSWA